MTAEELFAGWLDKQDYWLKALYQSLSLHHQISEDDLKEIIDSYVQKKFYDLTFTVEESISHGITLSKLYDVQGVNRLIQGQEIVFGTKLTVVYGENGTGKTGYSRIIQQIGNYIGDVKPIKPNVFEADQTPHAKIDYKTAEGELTMLDWHAGDGAKLGVKLFNNECVRFSLNNERKIDFQPYIFYVCGELADATSRLGTLVSQRLNELSQAAICPVIAGTEIHKQIAAIITECSVDKLRALDEQINSMEICALDDEQKKLNIEKDKCSIAALEADWRTSNSLQKSIQNIISATIKSEFYKSKKYQKYLNNEKRIKELQDKTDVKAILSRLNIDESISSIFEKFIFEADKLYKLLTHDKYGIQEMHSCILCGQSIESDNVDVHKILHLYGDLIAASKADSIDKLLAENKAIENSQKQLIHSLQVLQQTPDIDGNEILSRTVKELITLFKDCAIDNFEALVDRQVNEIITFDEALVKKSSEIQTAIQNNEEKRKDLNLKLNEIKAKIDVYKNYENIRAYLLSYINLSVLKSINNHGISKCQKDIQEKLYKNSFMSLLQTTLNELNAPPEVKFNTAISSSRMAIKQGYDKIVKGNQLNEILSEGEQTVVALAQFIAESKFNPHENVLFFDDPVNSLDLKRMQTIAKTLVSLAKEKQVVIFTHNYVFLSFLKAFIDKKESSTDYKFYQTEPAVQDGKNYVGKVTERDNPNIETYEYYHKEVEKIIKRAEKDPVDLKEIKHAYGCLRCAIELLIGDKILKGTVERYKPDISVIRFSRINLSALQEDQESLTELYENICRYIDGHSSALEAKIDPDITTLKSDYSKLSTIAKRYK